MDKEEMRMLISTGHLGTAPSKQESFFRGIETMPDFVVADGGSADPGPVYLGADISLGYFAEDELELMLVNSRKKGIPMIVGSARDAGTNNGVDSFVNIIKVLAKKHKIPKFKIGYFYSEVPKSYLKGKLKEENNVTPLGGFPDLTSEDIESSSKIVGLAGVHPFIKLLDEGADVIIGGRCGDIAFIAAPAIRAGFPEAFAYHMGKIIECASFCAEPFGGKETVIGTISREDIKITPYNPQQRCTVASISGHSMYERANPYFEYATGGMLDLRECKYEQFDEKTTRVTGAKWIPAEKTKIKIEGAKYIGERYMGISGIRDPYLVQRIDDVVQFCKESTDKQFGKEGYQIFFHVFGKNGILKEMEPIKKSQAHEMCIVIEVVSTDENLAAKVTDYALRMTFLARIPGVKGTAGAAATSKLPMKASPGYIWSINHTITVDDPMELFQTYTTYAGV
jgi:hypothetical protein